MTWHLSLPQVFMFMASYAICVTSLLTSHQGIFYWRNFGDIIACIGTMAFLFMNGIVRSGRIGWKR